MPGRSHARRWRPVLAVVVVGLVAAGGAAARPFGSATQKAGTSALVIANAVKVDTLDPANNSVNESIWLDQNIWGRLVQPNANGTGLIPDLATKWTTSKDGLTYRFTLRSAKFSDGSPITAEDARFSIDRSMKYKGGWGFLLDAVKKVSAPDAKTVQITLKRPHAPLLADLAMYAYAIVPKK